MNLNLNYYTQWYWKIDLHNLLHFLALRIDDHAQYEIRVYGEAMARIAEAWVPMAWEAFTDYRLRGALFSRAELQAIKARLRGETPDLAALGLSPREQREFYNKLGLRRGSRGRAGRGYAAQRLANRRLDAAAEIEQEEDQRLLLRRQRGRGAALWEGQARRITRRHVNVREHEAPALALAGALTGVSNEMYCTFWLAGTVIHVCTRVVSTDISVFCASRSAS